MTLALTASSAACVTEADVRIALAGNLGGADMPAVRNFKLSYAARRRRLGDRSDYRLDRSEPRKAQQPGSASSAPDAPKAYSSLSSPTTVALSKITVRRLGMATATFIVVASLATVGYADSGSFESALAGSLSNAVSDGSLTASLQDNCSCADVGAASVTVAATQPFLALNMTADDPSVVASVAGGTPVAASQNQGVVMVGIAFAVGLLLSLIISRMLGDGGIAVYRRLCESRRQRQRRLQRAYFRGTSSSEV